MLWVVIVNHAKRYIIRVGGYEKSFAVFFCFGLFLTVMQRYIGFWMGVARNWIYSFSLLLAYRKAACLLN